MPSGRSARSWPAWASASRRWRPPPGSRRAAAPCQPPGRPGRDGPAAAKAEGLSEELVLVISAAIAAFLGKKPHIRQIRLLGSAAWAQQGRVTIQASHALSVHHG